ncbi:MAG TPA: hypothetical protein VJ552_13430 [Sediminibacterium sp.]|nr:hypothetical protein [Sediminibacterium sp.]
MLKNRLLLLLIFISTMLLSCTKNIETPTAAEKTAIELQRVIQEQHILRVYPVKINDVFPDFFLANTGTEWKFSNGFVQINYGFSDSYNLQYLQKYAIVSVSLNNNTSSKALILFF